MSNPEQISLAYLVRKFEMMIDAPRKAVWPYLLDFTSFNQTFEKVELLSGEENCVGAVSLLTKLQGKWFMPPYLVKVIRVIPEEQIVWKMFPREGEGFFGFVDFRIEDNEGKTKFIDQLYFEYKVPRMADAKVAEYEERLQKDYEALEKEIFRKLKSLAERKR